MTRSNIAALILAHLAASPLVACKEEPPPVATPPVAAQCKAQTDCAPELDCVLATDGHRLIPGSGTCQAPGPHPGGRPLIIEGKARVAPMTTAHAWGATAAEPALANAALREQLLRDAADEHASVASFARTICHLLALGAPAWLVESTQRALADEIAHAKSTLAWAHRLGAETGPGPLPEAIAPFAALTGEALAADLLRDVLRGGCVGETLAAHAMAARAVAAPLDGLRALYTEIAHDEARHAALAYELALWLVGTFPALAPVLDEEHRTLVAALTEEERVLLAPIFAVLLRSGE